MPETVLWLIRHPETEQSSRGVCYGSLDVQLSPAGIAHAGAIAEAFARQHVDAIYSSPRQRCTELATRLAALRGGAWKSLDALRELDFGDFEGRSYDEIAADFPEIYRAWMEHPTEVHFPGGETFRQLRERVLAATRALVAQHNGEKIVCVTHGGPIRVILADALRIEMRDIFKIAQPYGAINQIRYSGGAATVNLVYCVGNPRP